MRDEKGEGEEERRTTATYPLPVLSAFSIQGAIRDLGGRLRTRRKYSNLLQFLFTTSTTVTANASCSKAAFDHVHLLRG